MWRRGLQGRAAEECPDNPWRFQNSALFSRLDAFLERCHDVLDLSQTAVQFLKLDRVEIGGTKGKQLTGSVKQILTDFTTAYEKFHNVEYNIMEIGETRFDEDFYKFRGTIRELERRLGSIIVQAFDDAITISATFKLLDSFEGLLERDVIAADIEKKHFDLLRSYAEDLKEVNDIFNSNKESPILSKNAAPMSGAVAWVGGLVRRIEEPMIKLRSGSKMIMETEEAKEINKLYNSMIGAMDEYKAAKFSTWVEEISETSDARLKLPLLCPGAKSTADMPVVDVNFDPDLVRLLKEVKYFLLLGVNVPEHALKIYQRANTFRTQVRSASGCTRPSLPVYTLGFALLFLSQCIRVPALTRAAPTRTTAGRELGHHCDHMEQHPEDNPGCRAAAACGEAGHR